MTIPAVEVDNVSVRFRLAERGLTFKEWTIRRLSGRLNWREVRALDGVSLTIQPGTAVGVMGPNGSGKSTLLRVIAGIIPPSEGRAVVRGRLAPIIELGTGFESELTGRENVFFNGALLGRSRREMQARFTEIIDFSGIGAFIDQPLRTYSTGMVARLAFSVATSVDADVILLDEILAVGDKEFRERCHKRIQAFKNEGRTIVLVTHDPTAVAAVCSARIELRHGALVASSLPGLNRAADGSDAGAPS